MASLKLLVPFEEGKGVREFLAKTGRKLLSDGWRADRRPARYPRLNRLLSIFKALIFDSKVDGGSPIRNAAPNGPATRP